MNSEPGLNIDELAGAAGTTVRNVRVYQDRGLVPPPERRGRVGYYGPDHLRRLHLVMRMLGRGYPLAAIRELVEAWEGGRGIAYVLGLEEAITAPYEEQAPPDVAYRTIDSPIGPLLLAATPAGLVRIGFGCENHDAVLTELSTAISPRVARSSLPVDGVARQLDEYFAGRRRDFEVSVDLRLSKGFRRAVLTHLLQIPYGARESYAAVAGAAGNPKAVRAAGSACATNPIPLVVPCHRVVRTDGSYGQYRGGPEVKRMLLTLESRE